MFFKLIKVLSSLRRGDLTNEQKFAIVSSTTPSTPLTHAHPEGFLSPQPFTKPALTVPEQIDLLLSRGLVINDAELAKHILAYVGYYRLSGYMLPFQYGNTDYPPHQFKEGATFEQVLSLYTFDRSLRLLVMDAIERIEVAQRTIMTNHLSVTHGPHWFMDASLFHADFDHARLLEKLKKDLKHESTSRTQAISIKHYYTKYNLPEFPPSWMVFENVCFGMVSTAYAHLHPQEQKAIAAFFSLHPSTLRSWLQSLAYVRNLCAHHMRLWNRIYTIKPRIADKYKTDLTPNDHFYAQACIIQIFLTTIVKESSWAQTLKRLLEDYPTIPQDKIGFPDQWWKRDLWQSSKLAK